MNYIEVTFDLSPVLPAREILIAELSEMPFESFDETPTGFKAYIQQEKFDHSMLDHLYGMQLEETQASYSIAQIEQQNWNAIWESSFDPIEVERLCLIRAPFHEPRPGFQHEIIIEPKMSFGTGHHATTWLMIRGMFEVDFTEKNSLDMGSGTGVLAILAEKLGSSHVDAIDIDEWAKENALENIERNGCRNITAIQGDKDAIRGPYNVILANINRNILVADMDAYFSALRPGGDILFSGFYETDFETIDEAVNSRATLVSRNNRDGWSMLHYRKTVI